MYIVTYFNSISLYLSIYNACSIHVLFITLRSSEMIHLGNFTNFNQDYLGDRKKQGCWLKSHLARLHVVTCSCFIKEGDSCCVDSIIYPSRCKWERIVSHDAWEFSAQRGEFARPKTSYISRAVGSTPLQLNPDNFHGRRLAKFIALNYRAIQFKWEYQLTRELFGQVCKPKTGQRGKSYELVVHSWASRSKSVSWQLWREKALSCCYLPW